MKHFSKISKVLTLLLCMLGVSSNVFAISYGDKIGEIKVWGELVAEPCVLDPDDVEIEVDFGTIVDKYLYLNTVSHYENFIIHLLECDPSVASTVSVTFMGNENPNLPGLLALDGGGGQASGVGVGILDADGELIAINTATKAQDLMEGDNNLFFRSFVQGEPDRLASKTIGLGTFTATAVFLLAYE